jgi:SAM-dependent methyltransferase
MASGETDRESLRELVTSTVLGPDLRRATFAGVARDGPTPWQRVIVRPLEIRGETHLQFSYFDGRKDTTKNFRPAEAGAPLAELLDVGFSGIHLSTGSEEIDVRLTKKGKVLVGRRKAAAAASPEPHNRAKDLPVPEGRADRLLEVMGVMTPDGRVRPTMRAKYAQINEFLKHLLHVIDDTGLRSTGRELEILDCGCGSSYLTLAVHHYLNDVLGVAARITGVDVNEEVIRKSVERKERLGADRIAFECSRIRGLTARPDIVLALHACDTATDEAIAQAVRGGAKLLLSVPCCHHALNAEIRAEGPAEVLRPLLRHGILRERTADLVTDAFRALALRIMGYRTDVVEFISTEHTARNLMIRAVGGLPVGEPALVREYVAMKQFWGVIPAIEAALGEPFQSALATAFPSPS